jgi:pimeloyl-ACP methyl ester carboxylesterase
VATDTIAMHRLVRFAVFSFVLLTAALARGQDALPAQKEIPPKGGGSGRVVVLVSGQTGPGNYTALSEGLAEQGFDVFLVDGNAFWGKGIAGGTLLRGVIERAQASSHAAPGKVGVVAASLGGATGLTYAARMPQSVGAVVVQYPLTSFVKDPADFTSKMQVPVLMLAGTFDSYKGCCMIDMARKLQEAARANGAPFDLVEYAGADHGFSTDDAKRRDVAADAMRRTVEFLRQHLGT